MSVRWCVFASICACRCTLCVCKYGNNVCACRCAYVCCVSTCALCVCKYVCCVCVYVRVCVNERVNPREREKTSHGGMKNGG